MRRVSTGMSPIKAGVLTLVLLAVAMYAAVHKSVPLRHHFTVQAVVQNANLIKPGSPVRIAGVDVGKVADVGRYRKTRLAVLTLHIDDNGQPLHRDATLKIRPRLFLEGNFYVDLQPGTPSAPVLGDGGMIPVGQTATPVQLDQVLTALQSDTRGHLQEALKGFGAGLNGTPSAADDAQQDPSVHGLTGGQALNRALQTAPEALRGTAKVSAGLLGRRPDDLGTTIDGFAKAMTALAQRERDLGSLVHTFNATMATTAAHSDDLRASVQELGPTAAHARAAFARLGAALGPTRRFAGDMATSIKELPATIDAAKPWLAQAEPLLGDRELGGLLDKLSPATQHLARLGGATRTWLPKIDTFNKCITDVFLPTGNIKVDDGATSANVENYKEFWYAMVGQNGEGQYFDGNGSYLRLEAASGDKLVETGNTNYSGKGGGPLFGNALSTPLGTRPAFGNQLPPLNRKTPCYLQKVPYVNGPASHGPADGSAPGAAPPRAPEAVK